MLLRRLLTQLLLLAVFFNTVIGMPAHEAGHLQHAAVAEATAPAALEDASGSEHGAEVESACAWCLAYAHLGIMPTAQKAVHASAVPAGPPQARAPEAFVPSPGRWPFSSRDPPRRFS
jgi:hypothetical protein